MEAGNPSITTKSLIESMPNKTKLETFLAKKYHAKDLHTQVEDSRRNNRVYKTVYQDSFVGKNSSKLNN